MNINKIHQRQQIIEEVLGHPITVVDQHNIDQTHTSHFSLFIGQAVGQRFSVIIDTELTRRERLLLEHLVKMWLAEDQELIGLPIGKILANWLIENDRASEEYIISEQIRTCIDWGRGWYSLGFTIVRSEGNKKPVHSQEILELQQLLQSYLPPQTIYISLMNEFVLCLVPFTSPQEGSSELATDEERQEWLNGLYDLCQNEFLETVEVLYHLPIFSPEDLIARVRDLIPLQKSLHWSLSTFLPISPWHKIIEQLVEQLSSEERKRILRLFKQHGSLQLVEKSEWYTTLSVFFRTNLNIASASKELYIHRNTLIYRLDRISEETGFDPRSFNDAMHLLIYIKLKQKEQFEQNKQMKEK